MTRSFSSYESLKGHKPYQYRGFTPVEFQWELEAHEDGHRTLVDIFFDAEHDARATLEEWGLLCGKHPVLKRTRDG